MNILNIPHLGIATATRCSCGAAVFLTEGPGYDGKAWEALCRDCYDGAEDAGERAHVRGFGASVEAALWDWQDKHDAAHEVEWCLTDLVGELARQLSEERERQRGWKATASPPVRRLDANAITIPPMTFYGPDTSQ